MTDDYFKYMLKSTGTIGICQYVHVQCEKSFLNSVQSDGKVIEQSRTKSWQPNELIGKFSEISHCDHCGKEFITTDLGYKSFWVTTQKEIDEYNEAVEWMKNNPR